LLLRDEATLSDEVRGTSRFSEIFAKEVIEPIKGQLREALATPEYRAEGEILQDTLPGWLNSN
jgi:hypothetical protein